jgi:hypothetical protein
MNLLRCLSAGLLASGLAAETWNCLTIHSAWSPIVAPAVPNACANMGEGGTVTQTATFTWAVYSMQTQSNMGSPFTGQAQGTGVCVNRLSPFPHVSAVFSAAP